MKKLLSAALTSALLLTASPALAATYLGDDMVFVENPIGGDAYAAGGKLMFEETVDGDLMIAGGDITVNGRITEDLTIAGGQIRIRGSVGDDIRSAGGEIEIGGNVQGDVIVFGGRIEILDSSTIAGDLIVSGGEVTMNGTVLGNTTINAGATYFSGTASRDLTIRGEDVYVSGRVNGSMESVSSELTIDSAANLRGDVQYWSKAGEVDFGNTVFGTVTFNEELKPYNEKHVQGVKAGMAAALGTLIAGAMLYTLLSTLLLIAIAVYGTRKYFVDGVRVLKKEPWMNALYGLLYFIATPILAVLLMATIIGIPVGAIVLAMYAITIALAKPMTAILLTKYWEATKRPKKAKAWTNWQVIFIALGVYVAMKIVALVPLLGSLVVAFAVCATYGALMRVEYAKYLKVR